MPPTALGSYAVQEAQYGYSYFLNLLQCFCKLCSTMTTFVPKNFQSFFFSRNFAMHLFHFPKIFSLHRELDFE